MVKNLFIPNTVISVAEEIEKGLLDGTICLDKSVDNRQKKHCNQKRKEGK